MSMFYSATERGFYHPSIHETMPDDAVEITDEQHRDLLDGQSKGGTIEPDKKGHPVLVPHVVTLEDAQVAHCSEIDAAADAVYRAHGISSPLHMAEYALLHPAEHKKLVGTVGALRDAGKAKVSAAKTDKTSKTAADDAVKALQAVRPAGARK